MVILRFMLVMVIYGSGFWVLGSGLSMPDYGLSGNLMGLFSRDER
jgi:hypothetical protein